MRCLIFGLHLQCADLHRQSLTHDWEMRRAVDLATGHPVFHVVTKADQHRAGKAFDLADRLAVFQPPYSFARCSGIS